MSAAADQAIRATARGLVQGVGYRYAVVERARELGVLGWVRNQDDGSVLVHAEGSADDVVSLATFLHQGPPGAAVEEVEVREVKPEGHEQFASRGVPAGPFVVEEHAGETPFFVLRLEVEGAMRSWRLAKAPSMNPADKRFATQLEGAATSASDEAPATQPSGHGPSDESEPAPTTWDSGTYEQGGRVAWPEAIERGHAVFVLHGAQLQGGFALQRTRGAGPRAGWLLIKRRDEFAAPLAR